MKKLLLLSLVFVGSMCYGYCSNPLQDETHDFINYDTTFFSPSGGAWNAKISRPRNGDPRQAIIFMVGVGEVGQGNFAGLLANGSPNGQLAAGWNGAVTDDQGFKHYPILISVSPWLAWPSTRSAGELLFALKNLCNITKGNLTGLSMGAMTWAKLLSAEQFKGDETYMKFISSFAPLHGTGTAYGDYDANGNVILTPAYQLGGDLPVGKIYEAFGIWSSKYHGRLFAVTGTNDFSGPGGWKMSEAMNLTLPGSAYFRYVTLGGGGHCCWNTEYSPSTTNWLTGNFLAQSAWDGTHWSNGTYKEGHSIYQWMLFDTLVAAAPPIVVTPPVVVTPPITATGIRVEAESYVSKNGGQYANAGNEGNYLAGMSLNGTVTYNVNLGAGTYTVNLRSASPQSAVFQLLSGATILGNVNLANTGDWSKWTTSTVKLTLPALTSITVKCLNKETANFNWIEFIPDSATTSPVLPNAGQDEVFTAQSPSTTGGVWTPVSLSVNSSGDVTVIIRLTLNGATSDKVVTIKGISKP